MNFSLLPEVTDREAEFSRVHLQRTGKANKITNETCLAVVQDAHTVSAHW